jgi:hypothetical protein
MIMLRGVNRQVLEITETNNLYYEKALLVVRPEYTSAQKSVLEKEAKAMLRRMKPPSGIRLKTKLLHHAVTVIASAVTGAGIASAIILCNL